MPTDNVFPALPLGFLLVLARITGVFVFIPLPFRGAGPPITRILFSIAVTLALFPRWPVIDPASASIGPFAVLMFSEAALGLSAGLLVGFLGEALTMSAQLAGLQAGYGYASVVDPNTEADSDVLQVLSRLTAGMLFFVIGLDRAVLRAFASSLEHLPPGRFILNRPMVEMVADQASGVFQLGLRIAFPILGLLLMVEIALAVVGRINMQMQLGYSAAPIKMLLTLSALAILLRVAPALYSGYAEQLFGVMRRLMQ